ncbi:hypothetical protein [Streptomyces sp. NPDC052015]|uniref:hypothetical protein n=1 Tax=Streptomyces sp. NPDC052015 TaxID=3154755 RepID=UPI0034324672
MTPADELRTAAEKLRALATAATPGPWRDHDTHLGQYGHTATVLSGERNTTDLRAWLPTMSQESWDETRNVWADAAYMAAMHPLVGLALADWLDIAVEYADRWPPDAQTNSPFRLGALAVARAINGGEQQ